MLTNLEKVNNLAKKKLNTGFSYIMYSVSYFRCYARVLDCFFIPESCGFYECGFFLRRIVRAKHIIGVLNYSKRNYIFIAPDNCRNYLNLSYFFFPKFRSVFSFLNSHNSVPFTNQRNYSTNIQGGPF